MMSNNTLSTETPMPDKNDLSRREFMSVSALAGGGLMLTSSMDVLAGARSTANTQSRGYAAIDTSGKLAPCQFEPRPAGDDGERIDIKFPSICHAYNQQMKGNGRPLKYPQVPGHEIVGVVAAVGRNVTKFKVGDRAGVGCMVDSNPACASYQNDEEQYCPETIFTYGYPDPSSPTGISQGGYSTNIVVKEHFAVHIPEHISFQEAAPLLCAGITTYSPLMKFDLKKDDKVGVAGIGGLGHMAIKLAVSKGAEVYAFTTSADKVEDILAFGAREAIVVDDTASTTSLPTHPS